MILAVKNILFTIFVPGMVAVAIPLWIVAQGRATLQPTLDPVTWPALVVICAGVVLYAMCVWNFATVGRGTPGPWDAPKWVVATGPYRWVRNPMYLAVLLVVLGEAWLFLSVALVVYAAAVALLVNAFVIGYEEPTLASQFGDGYEDYRRTVPRWIPRSPARRLH